MKKTFYYLIIASIALIINACANPVSPTGGPKDEMPPVVLETSPDNYSCNFSDKDIKITFDEFVTLDNATKNVLISPPLEEKPEYRLSGKTLHIKFEEKLKPETTYSINFGNAIKDLHEGNVLKDYAFVFSTGEIIDTLSLAGNAMSAFTQKPDEDFFVFLYVDENDTVTFDSLPYRVKPNYITKTNKNGDFIFSGLADKEYLLFAISDINSNLIFDLPNEEIGFYPELVKPQYIPVNQFVKDSIKNDSLINDTVNLKPMLSLKPAPFDTVKYQLMTFVQEDSIQKLFKKELVEDRLLRFVFRYPAEDVDIKPLGELPDSVNIIKVFSPRKDTISYYFTPTIDSICICVNYDTIICDTTNYGLTMRKSVKPNKRKNDEEEIKRLTVSDNLKGGKLKPNSQFFIIFNEPIVNITMDDSIMFVCDKDTIYNDLQFIKLDEYGFKYTVDKNFEPEKKYQIVISDSVFYGIRGCTNEQTQISLSIAEDSQYGNIYLTIEKPDDVPQLIVELLGGDDKVIDKQIITKTQEVAFEYVDPSKYKLRVIFDMDANGIWSPGNYLKKLQPEKIVFYKTELEVKANWDIDLEEAWDLR